MTSTDWFIQAWTLLLFCGCQVDESKWTSIREWSKCFGICNRSLHNCCWSYNCYKMLNIFAFLQNLVLLNDKNKKRLSCDPCAFNYFKYRQDGKYCYLIPGKKISSYVFTISKLSLKRFLRPCCRWLQKKALKEHHNVIRQLCSFWFKFILT